MTGWLTRSAVLLAASGLLIGGYADAASAPRHGTPVIEPAPDHAPAMKHVNGSCVPSDGSSRQTTGKKLLWVHAHPTGFIAIWIPGLNSKRCVARRTTSGATLAERLAVAIRHTKAFPTEPLPCPYDDGTSVRLYFTYASGGDEYADVALGGCRPISAPGRASRWSDPAVEKALHKAAPPAWRSYLVTN